MPGGIDRMMEHWIEQFDQTGFQFDVAYCLVGLTKSAAEIQATMERRESTIRLKYTSSA